MRRRSFLIRAAAVAAAVGGGLWLKDNVIWRRPRLAFGPDGGGWLPFAAPDALLPTARARLGGREVIALIDSGAQYSVVDRGLAEDLGLDDAVDMPLVAYGMDGRPQLGRGTMLDLTIADLTISGLRAGVLDLGPLARVEGLGAPLVLGRDVLMEAVLEMDLRRRRLRFLASASGPPGPAYRPTPVRRAGTALIAEATVEGAVVRAVVDTGASALLSLGEGAAAAAGLLDGRPAQAGSSLVLGGVAEARIVRARTVSFGDDLWRDVATPVFPDRPLPHYPEALLGMAAFAGRDVWLDLAAGQLHLAPLMEVTVA